MFLAMNRFKIALGYEEGFEKVWKERNSYVNEVDGFVSLNLMKGAVTEEYVLYASHSVWQSKHTFEAWTKSEHFRKAHAQANAPKGTYLGHPDLELFDAVI